MALGCGATFLTSVGMATPAVPSQATQGLGQASGSGVGLGPQYGWGYGYSGRVKLLLLAQVGVHLIRVPCLMKWLPRVHCLLVIMPCPLGTI